MPGTPHSLQQHADGPGRTDLADQVDNPDINAEFQGCGGNADLDLSAFQLLLGG